MRRGSRTLAIAASFLAVSLLSIPAMAEADFGIVPGSVEIIAENRDGTPAHLAGAHPYQLTIHFELEEDAESGSLREAIVDLPPGLIGNPAAVPSCPRAGLDTPAPNCPTGAQVGFLRAVLPNAGESLGPLYNVAPPPGSAAMLGFSTLAGLRSLQYAGVRTESGYGIRITAPDIPVPVSEVTVEVWGAPADSGHDPLRTCHTDSGTPFQGCSSDAPEFAFLTLPASCDSPPEVTVRASSTLHPGVYSEESASLRDLGDHPTPLTNCESVPFKPSIAARPTTQAATSSSGLDFELKLPNQGLTDPGLTAETEPRKTVVTLPEGMTVNPSFAQGAEGCTEAAYKAEQIDSGPGEGCPDASKLGNLTAQSPLLEEAIEGSVYLAEPYENPFGTLAALYLVARAPERGVLVKQAGKVELDPATGQITTSFSDLPPLPYSSFKLHLREGPRAPLVTPSACGSYETVARMTPFSAPDDSGAVEVTSAFTVTGGPEGSGCPAAPPRAPGMVAGSLDNAAGAFSPFYLSLTRTDSEPEIRGFGVDLPPGLSAKLAGVPACTEDQIAAARSREGIPGGGADEFAGPSCPAASRLGSLSAGAGVGPSLAYAPGSLYLAGPFEGAPISIVAITAAKVGPFDLGTVVVRLAARIDPETAQVRLATSPADPLPRILSGVPVRLRQVSSTVDRSRFTLNPTSCAQKSISALLTFPAELTAPAQSRFQAADCAALAFKPHLTLRFKGKTKRTAHPKVIATLTAKEGEANTGFAQVTLPKAAFLDQGHIKTVCTRVQFAAGDGNGSQCPAGSVYGRATARTPLLDYPLPGTVFLRSSDNVLPDLVVAFSGPAYQPIHFALAGKTDSVKGALRNTFSSPPDVPVSSFRLELFGGRRGLVELSDGFCANRRALVRLKGHSGATHTTRPEVVASCGEGKQGRGNSTKHRR